MTRGMTRRQVMASAGAGALAAGSLSSLKARAAGTGSGGHLRLVDATLPARWRREFGNGGDGAPVILQDELVRQWRQGLCRQVTSRAGATIALVRWDKLLVLEGLAREERLAVSSERIDRQTFLVTL